MEALKEVDALRKARLQAADYKFALERATNELETKGQVLEHLQARVDMLAGAAATAPPPGWEAELHAARADAERSRRKLAAAELELARQLDALQGLQGRLDAVAGQLAREQQWQARQPSQQQQQPAASLHPADPISTQLIMSSLSEELRAARLAAAEYRRRLALAELELSAARAAAAAAPAAPRQPSTAGGAFDSPGALLRPRAPGEQESEDEEAGTEGEEVCLVAEAAAAAATGAGQAGHVSSERHVLSMAQAASLGPCGRELVAALMKDNRELRARLQASEAHAAALDAQCRAELAAARQGAGAPIAVRLLQQRLEEQEAAAERLQGSLRAAEGKLVEAYQRQSNIAAKESDRLALEARVKVLEGDNAKLAATAEASKAEAEGARREAAAYRRQARKLQKAAEAAEAAAAGAAGAGGEGGSAQAVAELLQKRVKVLEQQNIKLRLAARQREEEQAAAAAARSAAARPRENASPNREVAAGASDGEAAAPAGGLQQEPENPVLAKWEADKRLQRRAEALAAKLQAAKMAAASAAAARSGLEEQAQRLQGELERSQAAAKELAARLAAAEERADPQAFVPVARVRELVSELEALQARHDALERQVAALQQQGVLSSAGGGGGAAAGEQAYAAVENPLAAASASGGLAGAAGGRSGSRAYLPARYSAAGGLEDEGPLEEEAGVAAAAAGGASDSSRAPLGQPAAAGAAFGASLQAPHQPPQQQQAALEAALREREVRLFDLQLDRDQAVAQAARLRRRLDDLFAQHGAPAVAGGERGAGAAAGDATLAEARQAGDAGATAGGKGRRRSGSSKGGAGGAAGASAREEELLDTVALLKAALERTRKGLESGVPASKYMAAVDRVKALKKNLAAAEGAVAEASRLREELGKAQAQLSTLQSTNVALKAQARAARERDEAAAGAREQRLAGQVAELERTLGERDAQLEALAQKFDTFGEEVRVLAAEGLSPGTLVQELLALRPRLRELVARNEALAGEVAELEAALAEGVGGLRAEHGLLKAEAERAKAALQEVCKRTGEPVPAVGL